MDQDRLFAGLKLQVCHLHCERDCEVGGPLRTVKFEHVTQTCPTHQMDEVSVAYLPPVFLSAADDAIQDGRLEWWLVASPVRDAFFVQQSLRDALQSSSKLMARGCATSCRCSTAADEVLHHRLCQVDER